MTDHVDTQTAVVATLPDGTKIAVDQLPTGELVQIVKLYDGAADSVNAASVSAAGALKVDGSGVTQPVSGPLTDAQLRATPVPVSGAVTVSDGSGPLTVDGTVAVSNFPATQPVSAAALPLPAGAATEGGHLAAIDVSTAKIPSQGQALAAGSVPVVLTAIQQAALTPPAAIAGFALEAGHLAAIDTSVAKIPSQGQALAAGSVPVVLTAIQQAALTPPAAITGFALDATLTGGSAKSIARGGQKGTTNTNADITHTPSGANHELIDVAIYDAAGNQKDPTAVRALTAADVVTVTPPALTKGTQAATGFSVQELKDAGRVNIMWTAEFSPTGVAEALLTMTESRDGAAVTTFTSKVITNGKRLRITSWTLTSENTLGANPKRNKVRMKFNTAGAVTTASPLQANLVSSVPGTVNTVGSPALDDFPDGIEYLGDGTKQIGFTNESPDWVTAAQTSKLYLTIFGYEY